MARYCPAGIRHVIQVLTLKPSGETRRPTSAPTPPNHVVRLLATPQQAAAAVADLIASGRFDEDDITLLCGPEGRARLDTSGTRRGPLGRVLRVLQHLGPEHEQLTRYASAIDDGALLIAVHSGTQHKRSRATS